MVQPQKGISSVEGLKIFTFYDYILKFFITTEIGWATVSMCGRLTFPDIKYLFGASKISTFWALNVFYYS